MITYKHPQGATITVYDDGTMIAIDKHGRPKKTSATPEKLAAGHGAWREVASGGKAPAMPASPPPTALSPLRPMKFAQCGDEFLDGAIGDDKYFFQQKLDGVRAQLVFTTSGVYARSTSGAELKSTVAGPVARMVIDAIEEHCSARRCGTGLPKHMSIVLDGEIINGEWWMFDMTTNNASDYERYEYRLASLEHFIATHAEISGLRLLSTARTRWAKKELLRHVREHGGEGVMVKHRGTSYHHNARITASLKYKITHTVDAVVVQRDYGGKENATLALWSEEEQTFLIIGKTSMIGKGDAEIGDVLEVKYLYAGSGGRLVQPTVLRRRDDKHPSLCTVDQLVFVNKDVIAL